jgi:hypothetical protein
VRNGTRDAGEPSGAVIRNRSQASASCSGQKPWRCRHARPHARPPAHKRGPQSGAQFAKRPLSACLGFTGAGSLHSEKWSNVARAANIKVE